MLSTTLSTIVIAPILAVVSIPLIISAYFTTTFSLLALSIRLAVIYIELSSAIVASYFSIKTSSDSLLTFTPSEPVTPNGTPPSTTSPVDYLTYASIPPSPSSSTRRQVRPVHKRNGSSISLDATWFSRRGNISAPPGTTAFASFISGDEHRDFEDVGGWRYLGTGTSNRGHLSRSLPSQSVCDNAEERAWLSINQRLELPSHNRKFSFGETGAPESLVRSVPAITKGHHRRSVTTSMLALPRHRGLGLAPPNRPDSPGPLSMSEATGTQKAPRFEFGDSFQGPLEEYIDGILTPGTD